MSEVKKTKAKLIYNPNAGKKRKFLPGSLNTSLEEIKGLLDQYQIPTDFYPTNRPGHATELAKNSIKEGYKLVIAAGGDGTVSETVNGLINSDVILAILPLGSFMNTAKMLSIPTMDLEKAVELIKIDRIRKIDVGAVIKIDGEKLSEPYYFLENAGIGMEARLQQDVLDLERGNLSGLIDMFKTFIEYYSHHIGVYIDNKNIETKATMVEVSNGPITAAALKLAPKAKLNDHRLTVSIFKMTKWELIKYVFNLKFTDKTWSPKIQRYQAKSVKVITSKPRPVHADASLFGTTPVEFKIIPSALNVICGFPKPEESSLKSRTLLDP